MFYYLPPVAPHSDRLMQPTSGIKLLQTFVLLKPMESKTWALDYTKIRLNYAI